MAKTLDEVSRDAVGLSEGDRFRLARILLSDSQGFAATNETDEEWEREIERRLGELESGKVKGISIADFKTRMEKRFGREG